MLATRFANSLFKPIWNRNYIDNVQITAAADIGWGPAPRTVDALRALRDLVQNHCSSWQQHLHRPPSGDPRPMRCATAGEGAPGRHHAQAAGTRCVGQYSEGVSAAGCRATCKEGRARGLHNRDVRGAAPGGQTSTGAGPDVPLPVRTGSVGRKVTEIGVDAGADAAPRLRRRGSVGSSPNTWCLTVQPNEGVSLSLGAKIPGTRMRIRPVNMEFLYDVDGVARGLRAPDHDDARRHAVHPQRRGRGPVADPRPRASGRPAGCAAPVPRGSDGPEEANDLMPTGKQVVVVLEVTGAGPARRPRAPRRARIEAALRELLKERFAEHDTFAPARVLNRAVIADNEWKRRSTRRLDNGWRSPAPSGRRSRPARAGPCWRLTPR